MGKPTAAALEAQAPAANSADHSASKQQAGTASSRQHTSRHAHHNERGDSASAAASSVAAAAAASSVPAASSPVSADDPVPIAADDDRSVAHLLQSLELHRAECESAHMYIEAERVRELAQAMRERQEAKHADALHSQQQAERQQRDQQLADEQASFRRERADRLRAFDAATADRERSMRLSHVAELEEWESKHVTQLLMIRPKYGKDILQLQAQQAALARSRNYVAAEKIRAKLEWMCERELQQLRTRCEQKAGAERERFHAAQEKAVSSLLDRRALERVQLESRLDSELQSQVLQRHVNHHSELLRAQSKQIGRLTKLASLDCSVSETVRELAPRRNHALLPLAPEPSGSASARSASKDHSSSAVEQRMRASPRTSSRGGHFLSAALQRRLAAEEWDRQHTPAQSVPAQPALPVVEEKSAASSPSHAITVPSIASLAAGGAARPSPALLQQQRHREQLQLQQEALAARNAPPPPSVPSPAAARTARQHHLAQLKARPAAAALTR